jgi:hypothetical protein
MPYYGPGQACSLKPTEHSGSGTWPSSPCSVCVCCRSTSDETTANTTADYRSAAIGLPGPGLVSARSGADGLVLAQRNTTAVNATRETSSQTLMALDEVAPTPARQDGLGECLSWSGL